MIMENVRSFLKPDGLFLTLFFHLRCLGIDFKHILECFIILLRRYGVKLWADQPPEFPQVKVDALRDNPAFKTLLMQDDEPQRFLEWYEPYLRSVWTTATFGDALPKMLVLFCVDLQHQRFDPILRSKVSLTLASVRAPVLNMAKQV